jgi:hypothetical protein
MPRENGQSSSSVEPEQIIAQDDSLGDQLEIHTIPDKFYGIASRISIQEDKPKQALAPSSGKKKRSFVWIIVGILLLIGLSVGGFIYFNQSLLFGEKEPVASVETPMVPQPPSTPVLPPAPSAPSGVTATATSQTAVQLNWTDTADNEAGFRVERREPTTEFSSITSIPPNSTAYQDRTVSAEREYVYRVIASNEGGDSSASNEASVSTPAEPPPAPEPAKLPPAGLDTDSDGITDLEEPLYGTNANDPDTDHDSFLDGNEVFHMYNPASGLNTRLLDTGLVKMVDSPVGWSIYVPSVWKSTLSSDGTMATFVTGHGESFAITMRRNPDLKSVMDWYLEANPGVISSKLNVVTTKGGIKGLESENKLHTYFDWGSWVIDFEYQLDGQPFVNFRQTYEMMKNSLKLNAEPLVSEEVAHTEETTASNQEQVELVSETEEVPLDVIEATGEQTSSSNVESSNASESSSTEP